MGSGDRDPPSGGADPSGRPIATSTEPAARPAGRSSRTGLGDNHKRGGRSGAMMKRRRFSTPISRPEAGRRWSRHAPD